MANKIGFRHYDDDKSTQNGEQSPKKEDDKQTGVTDKDLFRLFIKTNTNHSGQHRPRCSSPLVIWLTKLERCVNHLCPISLQ